MNIKQVKKELIRTIQAYLLKNEDGEYRMDFVRQRPVLLIGPPGIGKTAVMEQVAKACGIGLVAYTITHHTRQSAIGLPFIREKEYGGTRYSVTEYTMSEIVAAVYEKMEQTGLKEGILFLDEINCVSETLAPTMLQFLQFKMFGNHKIPEGWVIVAAGNPPEYNKSVREFDLVTLDRVRKITVEEDYGVWKEYAYQKGIHSAIIGYLDLKKENFYHIQMAADGMEFVTARGWEDLSEMIGAYETIHVKPEESMVVQYLQDERIARDFANYLDFYYKYQTVYDMEAILSGGGTEEMIRKLEQAPFDERLSVIRLLMGSLGGSCRDAYLTDRFVSCLFDWLKQEKETIQDLDGKGEDTAAYLAKRIAERREKYQKKKKADLYTREEAYAKKKSLECLDLYAKKLKDALENGERDSFAVLKKEFQKETARRQEEINTIRNHMEQAFSFVERAFGESQEMVIFLTELAMNFYTLTFIRENGCEAYYHYNETLLFEEKQKKILEQIQSIEDWENL